MDIQIASGSQNRQASGQTVLDIACLSTEEKIALLEKTLTELDRKNRELKIEAALDMIRTRAMAMQCSDELTEVLSVLFEQFDVLGITPTYATLTLVNLEDSNFSYWLTGKAGRRVIAEQFISLDAVDFWQESLGNWKRGKPDLLQCYEIPNEMLPQLFDIFSEIRAAIPEDARPEPEDFPNGLFVTQAYCQFGYLGFGHSRKATESEIEVLKRFAREFCRMYQRFLDLQKAEAQAREAQVEAGLEKVRSRTIAMHSSEDVSIATATMFAELGKLGIQYHRGGILNIRKDQTMEVWSINTLADGSIVRAVGLWDMTLHPWWRLLYKGWVNKDEFLYYFLAGKEKENYVQLLNARSDYLPNGIQELPDCHIQAYYFDDGAVWNFSLEPHSAEHKQVMKRFASVFSLTFRRYQDLKNAETQAREAIKASSLDRIRAEIASMRTAYDLQRITPSVWTELTTLGVPFFRCGVFIFDEKEEKVHVYLSTPDGKALAVLHMDFDTPDFIVNAVAYWRMQKTYIAHWDREQFKAWVQLLIAQGQIQTANTYQGGDKPPETLTLQLVPFAQGMLYVGSVEALTEDQVGLVKALAEAFSVAYARYEDFKKLEEAKNKVEATLNELRTTQKQLVQSEKMASLGELTAGIAHEIQNPLNFVNNFSELSMELVWEMKEAFRTDNKEDVLKLAAGIEDNLQKITYHGKRADAIVKGMLQHSRKSTGEKQLVDISALASEYLRLSYHGMRAKEKDFTAIIETHFDNGVGKINVVPQDIGRVLLNLFNNAFYAVNEKRKQLGSSFLPTVTVNTHKEGDLVTITVTDNGTGMTKKVVEKVFQPFFTTKPTGEGTGLGLSLSYDIVTNGHGGDIRVKTKEGEGAEFSIRLPLTEKKMHTLL